MIALLLGPFGAAGAAEYYGVDPGGSRYAELAQINTGNVDRLVTAWNYRTGDLARRDAALLRHSKFEVTPILVDGRLLICTPFNEVIALDPGDGHELWRFDPKIATDYRPANLFACRGVAFWRDSGSAAGPCATRVLTVTNDARLIALDLETGRRCAEFGQDGEVRIEPGKPLLWPGEWQMTSAPTVYADLVIVGSSIGDNQRVDEPRGTVRAFDVRTGALRWDWDPIPRRADDPAAVTWGEGWRQTGAANVWAPMSVDPARHLVFLPTTSPSPDFYGGLRPGDNLYADSVVALKADTGEQVLELPDRASRCLGLRRRFATLARLDHARWQAARCRHPEHQARPHLCARPGDGAAGAAGRGTKGAAGRRCGRSTVADPTFSGRSAASG